MSAKSFNPLRRQFYSLKLAHALFVSLPNWMAAGMRSLRNETVKWAFLLGGAAFLLSSFFVLLVAQPTINVVDGPTYHRIGYHLAQEFQYNAGAYPYPLYPIFLAVIYALGGAYFAVYLVQGLLLALTVGLSYWLARHVAGHGAGVFAALLVTLDASLLGNVGLIATENLQSPLLMLAIMLSLYAVGQQRMRHHFGAGVLWGLLTLVKPATLLWPLALLPVYAVTGRGCNWLKCWLFLLFAFLLVLSPWLARNQLSAEPARTMGFGQPFPALLHHVLDEGDAKHNSQHVMHRMRIALAEAEAQGIEPGSIQFQLYTLRLLMERIARSPQAYGEYLWESFSFFWTEPPVVWSNSVYNSLRLFPQGYREVPGYVVHSRLRALMAIMGLLSLLVLYRRKPRVAFHVTAFLLYYSLFYTMTVVNPRFSVPIVPLVLVGAAVFPSLATAAIGEKLANYRILSNTLLAAIVVVLLSLMATQVFLQRSNYVQGGSFETDLAQEEWTFEEVIGEPRAPLVVEPYRARDGFRAAVLSIGPKESGIETRFRQDMPVWFDTKYRLKFSYLFTEEEMSNARLYVEVLEWDIFEEGWKRIRKEFQPAVTHIWTEREYEFEVSGTAREVSVIFGLLNNPGTVLIDNVRLELAASSWEVIERPYLLRYPGEINPNNHLPLDKWVKTQPEGNRSFLLNNAGVARANGWRGDEGTLDRVAFGVGIGVLVAWAAACLLFVRVRLVERMVRARLLELGSAAVMVLLVTIQAATCYLLLFSNPA